MLPQSREENVGNGKGKFREFATDDEKLRKVCPITYFHVKHDQPSSNGGVPYKELLNIVGKKINFAIENLGERLEDRIDGLEGEVKRCAKAQNHIGKELKGMNDKMRGQRKRIHCIEDKIDGIEDKIDGIEGKLDMLINALQTQGVIPKDLPANVAETHQEKVGSSSSKDRKRYHR